MSQKEKYISEKNASGKYLELSEVFLLYEIKRGENEMANTATRAEKRESRTITFKNKEHEKFYRKYLPQCRYQDVYHKALIYCLGISRDTRDHVKQIYDFRTGNVKSECLHEGWQTSGSGKIIRMAYNLYCNGTPSVYDYNESDTDGQLKECRLYTVEELFCCGYARYFWEAIKIRYPEYCFCVDWEAMYVKDQIAGDNPGYSVV